MGGQISSADFGQHSPEVYIKEQSNLSLLYVLYFRGVFPRKYIFQIKP